MNKLTDVRLACSDAAGHFLFGNSDFEVIKTVSILKSSRLIRRIATR